MEILNCLQVWGKSNANKYGGTWFLPYVTRIGSHEQIGDDPIQLVPGLKYVFSVGYDGRFYFEFDTNGQVHVDNPESSRAKANVLELITRPYEFRVKKGIGWEIAYVAEFSTPSAHIDLVPELDYKFVTENQSAVFRATADGMIQMTYFQWGWENKAEPVFAGVRVVGSAN